MRIFVTGAAGYIGSVLVPRLLSEGHSILAMDNLIYQPTSLLACCHDERFEFVRGDVRDADLLRRCISKVDAIIPLACLTGAAVQSRPGRRAFDHR